MTTTIPPSQDVPTTRPIKYTAFIERVCPRVMLLTLLMTVAVLLAVETSYCADATSQPSVPVSVDDVMKRMERLEAENAALRRELVELRARPTTAPTAFKDENHRAAVAKFVGSAGPYIKELRTMRARLEIGITPNDYADKVAAMVEAFALVDLPTGNQQLTDLVRQPLDLYRKAAGDWKNQLEFESLAKKYTKDDLRNYCQNASTEAAQARERAWEEAAKITDAIVRAYDIGGDALSGAAAGK